MLKPFAILIEQQYQVLEVWYPFFRLKEAGIPVKMLGTVENEIYPSKEGYPARSDAAVKDVSAGDFSGVLIPGGFAPDFMRRYPEFAKFVRAVHDQKGIVASICHGGWMLVSADILKGREATCFFAIKDDLIAAGCQYRDEEVVVDGNLITSRKPEDLPAFVVKILKQLQSRSA